MGFLSFLSPAITAASDVAGGYAQGQEKVKAQQLQQALLAQKQKRQDAIDALSKRNIESEIAHRGEHDDTGVTYQQDADGNIIALPTHLPNAGAAKPTAPIAAAPTPEGAPTGPALSPSPSAGPSASAIESASPPATPVTPAIGIKTGIKGVDPVARAVKIAQATKAIPTYSDLHPRDTYSATPGIDPATGKPTVYTLNTKTGKLASTGVGRPEPAGGNSLRGLGQGGVFGAGSGIGAVNEMQAANPNLKAYEKGFLVDGPDTPSQLGALDRFRQRLANDLATHGTITAATASEAERELAATNPDLVVYGRNLKQWIVADLNLSRSATDKRGALDMEVSGLSIPLSSMPASQRQAYVHQIWEARDARLSGLQTAANTAQVMLDRVTGKQADPTAGMSDADAWEHWRQQGLSAADATAKVHARKK